MAAYPIVRSTQVSLLAVASVFIALPTVALICRLIAKRKATRSLDWTDFHMFIAWLAAVALQVLVFPAVLNYGVGFHAYEIEAMYGEQATQGFHILILPVEACFAISLGCCKFSVLLLYKRLFGGGSKPLVYAVHMAMALIATFLITAILGGALVCTPFSYQWDKSIPGGHCGDILSISKAAGSLNVVTDFLTVTIALPRLYELKLPWLNKIALLGAFAIILVTCVVGIIRIISLAAVDFSDITYSCYEALIWTSIEPSLAVVLACVPLLRPLFGGQTTPISTGSDQSSARYGDLSRKIAIRGNIARIEALEPINDDGSSNIQLHSAPSSSRGPRDRKGSAWSLLL